MTSTRLLLVFALVLVAAAGCRKERSRQLFNGKDLTGWDTYIGPRYDTAKKGFDSLDGPGLNNDPDRVFSVVEVDGGPAIRVSGTQFGGLSTTEEFSDYHLSVEFRWGEQKSAPKLNDKRDSGLLYHAVGPHGADYRFWMRSQEFQIQEGDCGDYWGVAGGAFDIPVKKVGDEQYIYDAAGELTPFHEKSPAGRHAIKSHDVENPKDVWNIIELYCKGDTAIHMMNGKVVMRLYHSRQLTDSGEAPLTKGKLQIQSEGAEVFYRAITIAPITAIPDWAK